MATPFDLLVPELERRFPGRGLTTRAADDGLTRQAVFPAIHPEVGDVVVEDAGHEFTVFFGSFTHAHYGWIGKGGEGASEAVGEVVGVLEKLFDGRLKMWGDHRGGGVGPLDFDGYRILGLFRILRPRGRQYVWTGPLER
ncbi:MAG TPA: hypothetical protein VFK48_16900 [Usitatibacter sp.]|nr:hypothetical protein [Usitatibacter sp.]